MRRREDIGIVATLVFTPRSPTPTPPPPPPSPLRHRAKRQNNICHFGMRTHFGLLVKQSAHTHTHIPILVHTFKDEQSGKRMTECSAEIPHSGGRCKHQQAEDCAPVNSAHESGGPLPSSRHGYKYTCNSCRTSSLCAVYSAPQTAAAQPLRSMSGSLSRRSNFSYILCAHPCNFRRYTAVFVCISYTAVRTHTGWLGLLLPCTLVCSPRRSALK
ncbi:unnamed protein product [Ceratitis capitata]|uniref:(Mediterranean fruit fly) hypothetical protein n=1 Tax=Ceratitis capitata TaxID=7213 RepID=A0A811UK06_CERCA|nr:unnamed protein product [Ceratitis capitata]